MIFHHKPAWRESFHLIKGRLSIQLWICENNPRVVKRQESTAHKSIYCFSLPTQIIEFIKQSVQTFLLSFSSTRSVDFISVTSNQYPRYCETKIPSRIIELNCCCSFLRRVLFAFSNVVLVVGGKNRISLRW